MSDLQYGQETESIAFARRLSNSSSGDNSSRGIQALQFHSDLCLVLRGQVSFLAEPVQQDRTCLVERAGIESEVFHGSHRQSNDEFRLRTSQRHNLFSQRHLASAFHQSSEPILSTFVERHLHTGLLLTMSVGETPVARRNRIKHLTCMSGKTLLLSKSFCHLLKCSSVIILQWSLSATTNFVLKVCVSEELSRIDAFPGMGKSSCGLQVLNTHVEADSGRVGATGSNIILAGRGHTKRLALGTRKGHPTMEVRWYLSVQRRPALLV